MLKNKFPNNVQLLDRLDIVEKYNNMISGDYLDDLKDDEENNKMLIKRCVEFQKIHRVHLKKHCTMKVKN